MNYKVAIVGRPNVGKSSLFNRIVGKRKAIVHDVAGTTRDVVSEEVHFNGKGFELLDTAGYLKEKGAPLTEQTLKKVSEAVEAADFLIFVVDGNVIPTKEDLGILEIIRKSGKNKILAINKIDSPKRGEEFEEYQKFGIKNMFPISVIHNIGVAELIEEVVKNAPTKPPKENVDVKVAIIGRPNVGKSSILNAVCKSDRAIVSNIPGTTRDVISEEVVTGNLRFKISDTGGARKPGKIGKAFKKGEPVERYSYLRTIREIEDSDIVLLVIDASDRVAAQDLHLAGKAKELGKGIIILVNKWDIVEDITQEKFLNRLRHFFNFMIWVPVVFVSAKTGRNVEEVTKVIETVSENQRRIIPTSKLNRILEDFILINPPKGVKNLKPKVFFAAQTGSVPPLFTISAKYHGFIHFSWRRAFENELRRFFDFTGTPISINFKEK